MPPFFFPLLVPQGPRCERSPSVPAEANHKKILTLSGQDLNRQKTMSFQTFPTKITYGNSKLAGFLASSFAYWSHLPDHLDQWFSDEDIRCDVRRLLQ